MRWNHICLSAVLLAVMAVSVQAVENPDKPAKEKAKAVNGQVTAISVGGGQINLTVKNKEAEKAVSMSSSVNVMMRHVEGKNIIMGLHVPGGKNEKPNSDKARLVAGTVTAASLDGELVKLTISTEGESVEGQMSSKVNVMLDKEGNAVAVRAAPGMSKDAPKPPKDGADAPKKGADAPKAPKDGTDKPAKEQKPKKSAD